MDFATRAVHAGLDPDPTYRSVIPAIHQTSTYAQRAVGEFVEDYDYARSANPTRAALERALGELEGGRAVAFSSGLAAAHATITHVCQTGDHVVLPADLYGGTYRLVDKVLKRWGLDYELVDQTDLDALERAVTERTRLIWVESPTNPLLDVIDIPAVIARRRNALVAVDNTFATPVQPAPARARRRPRRALDDEVPRRPQRRRRRRRDRRLSRRSRRGCASSRTPSAPSPGRSTASSCTAACARSR